MDRFSILNEIKDKDAYQCARREGQRSVVLHMLKVLKSDLTAIEKAYDQREKQNRLEFL